MNPLPLAVGDGRVGLGRGRAMLTTVVSQVDQKLRPSHGPYPRTAPAASPRATAAPIAVRIRPASSVPSFWSTWTPPSSHRPASAQATSAISDGNRQWIITAYALTFGGCCSSAARSPTCGAAAAPPHRLIGFAAASVLGGRRRRPVPALRRRAAQGVFGALLAPAALSLLTVLFKRPKERGKAFGLYARDLRHGAADRPAPGWCSDPSTWTGAGPSTPRPRSSARRRRCGHHHSASRRGAVTARPRPARAVLSTSPGRSGLRRHPCRVQGLGDGGTLAFLAGSRRRPVLFVSLQAKRKDPLLPLRVITDRTAAVPSSPWPGHHRHVRKSSSSSPTTSRSSRLLRRPDRRRLLPLFLGGSSAPP